MAKRSDTVPVDADMVKARMKELKLTYRDIEDLSEGRITEISLKHILNKGKNIDEEMLDTLSGLLEFDKNLFVDKNYILSINLPFEVNRLIGNLYLRDRKKTHIFYSQEIRKFRKNADLRTILHQAHYLYQTISIEDYVLDKSAFVRAFNLIATDFNKKKCLANMHLTEIQDVVAENLYSKITEASGNYNSHQVILMFLYVFILFDAIFLEEAVASVTQLVPQRDAKNADPYYLHTYRCENMRNALMEYVLYKGVRFDGPEVTELSIDDRVISGIILMLAASEKCYLHLNDDYADSEYVNTSEFSAILTQLEKIFETLGIVLPENDTLIDYFKMITTRFGKHYNMLKWIFNEMNPPRKPRNKEAESYINGAATTAILISNMLKEKT